MFELLIGTDTVRRQMQGAIDGAPQRRSRRSSHRPLRARTAILLRALADRVEPAGAGRSPEAAGACPR